MFYGQCWKCGERWELGTASTCTCPDEALADQPTQQEPVAWQVMVEDEAMKEFSTKDIAHDWCVQQKLSGSSYTYWIRPLYTRPLAREWVGLTNKELNLIGANWHYNLLGKDDKAELFAFARAIESALRSKNHD